MEQGFPWEDPRIYKRLKPWVPEFLTSYQREAWAWLHERGNNGANLWWACGSGKTLAALLFLVSGPAGEKKIIVTRATTKGQWQREASQYTDLKVRVLNGKTASDIDPSEEAVVLSWEILPDWYDALSTWVGRNPEALVWDEIHKGKAHKRRSRVINPDGTTGWRLLDNRAAYASRLSKRASRRLGLTATPIRDRRSDLWAQLDLIQPGAWGSSWDFVHYFCDARQGLYGGLDTTGRSNCEELKLRLEQVTHAVSYAAMARELPPKRRQLIYLAKDQQLHKTGMRTELKAAAKRGGNALFEARLMDAAVRKRKWIRSAVKDAVEADQKVVVFTGRRKDCDVLLKQLEKDFSSKDVPVLGGHGGDSVQTRWEAVKEYAAHDGAAVFVGTHDAFGEAIDGLQHTDVVYFVLLPWTPGQVTQAEGRFSRHGSDRPVLISYLVAEGTVDEHVADVLLEKLEGVAMTLDDKEAGSLADTLAGMGNEDEIMNSILEAANVTDETYGL